MIGLPEKLEAVAGASVLLVACDFDGTLSPIVSRPDLARPEPAAVAALERLAGLPRTHAAVISGRSLRDLATLIRVSDRVKLVGSHGGEFEAEPTPALSPQQRELRHRIVNELRRVAAAAEGFLIEEKPASVAFHYRLVERSAAEGALLAVRQGPGAWPGVYPREGKKVIELSVVPCGKADAVARLRQCLGASAVVFFGDDLTDEEVFSALTERDVGVKVGEGETAAAHRATGPHEVARLLERLAGLRGPGGAAGG